MDLLKKDPLALAGVAIGMILLIAYGFYAAQKHKPFELGDAAILFLSGSGLIGGIRIFIFAFDPIVVDLTKNQGIDISYIIIGGIALAWVSILGAYAVFQKLSPNTTKTTPPPSPNQGQSGPPNQP